MVIVQTAVDASQNLLPIIVTQNVDVLVILAASKAPEKPLVFLKPKIGRVKWKLYPST